MADVQTSEVDEKLLPVKKKRMSVSMGVVAQEDPAEKKQQQRQEYKLREKMIKNKHRKLYRSMMKGRAERGKAAWLLAKKRRLHDEQEKAKRNAERREKRMKSVGDVCENSQETKLKLNVGSATVMQ